MRIDFAHSGHDLVAVVLTKRDGDNPDFFEDLKKPPAKFNPFKLV